MIINNNNNNNNEVFLQIKVPAVYKAINMSSTFTATVL